MKSGGIKLKDAGHFPFPSNVQMFRSRVSETSWIYLGLQKLEENRQRVSGFCKEAGVVIMAKLGEEVSELERENKDKDRVGSKVCGA